MPFPDMRFVATGGIALATAPEFLEAGSSAVALGSALTEPGSMDGLARLWIARRGQTPVSTPATDSSDPGTSA
jgi:2-keto-3-deoxy-6-phosphogluconate aldolase